MLEQSCNEDLELKKQTYDLASESTQFSSDEQESSLCFECEDHVSSVTSWTTKTVSQHRCTIRSIRNAIAKQTSVASAKFWRRPTRRYVYVLNCSKPWLVNGNTGEQRLLSLISSKLLMNLSNLEIAITLV
jgi:hypothetical protein